MKIKKTSKIMALVLAVAMVLAFMPVMMVSAATDPVIGTMTPSINAEKTVLTIEVPYSMTATGSDEVTILVTKDSAEITYSDPGPNTLPTNIVYIDQTTYEAPLEGESAEFTFSADVPATTSTYYVKVGGTAIDSPASATTVVEIVNQVNDPVIDASNIATAVSVKTQDNVYGVAGAKLVVIDISSLITVEMNATSNDYNIVVKDTELRYNPVNSKFFGTPSLGTTPIVPADITITRGPRLVPNIIFGDVNSSGTIVASDLGLLKRRAAGDATLLANGDMSGDVNLSGTITAADLGLLKRRAAGDTTKFVAEN